MLTQIVDALGPSAPAQILGAADNHEGEGRCQPDRNHVGGDELAEPDAGVKSSGRDIDQFLTRGDLHLDLGIGLAEGCNQRLQQDRHYCPRHREAQQPGRSLPKIARNRARGDELLEGGLCARKESFAGFGQAETARRADEKCCADARLKCAYRLADRRWCYPELRGRFAKTAVLGDAQERLYAAERALPDCEVLLHNPSTLSRIVDRGKRSYIQLANPQSRRTSGVT